MTEVRAAATVPRLVELDALRGFALGGILLVNMTVMAGPGGFPGGFALDLLDAVFRNKFYVLAARIWVRHYRYGPIELFLCAVTYGPR